MQGEQAMTEELKSCPFCGGPARLVHDYDSREVLVKCDWCVARVAYSAYCPSLVKEDVASVIADWNKRVEQ